MNRFSNFDFQSQFDATLGQAFTENPEATNLVPGTLLVASTGLKETPFHKTVVLVLQNNEKGTFGAVLNRPATESIRDAWQHLTGADCEEDIIVQGGPINGPVYALHQVPQIADHQITDNLFISAEKEAFETLLIGEEIPSFRIVFGVAAWQPGQLQQEVESGLWFSMEVSANEVFEDPQWHWERSLKRYGQRQLCSVVGPLQFPSNALMN